MRVEKSKFETSGLQFEVYVIRIDAPYLIILQDSASNFGETPTKLRGPPIKLFSLAINNIVS